MSILPDCNKVCGTAFSHINMTTVNDDQAMNIHIDEDVIFTQLVILIKIFIESATGKENNMVSNSS